MKTLLKRQYTVAVLLLFVSLFSLSPTLTRADQQSQTGTASIDLSGQAMPFDSGNGTATPVMLSLAGIVQGIGNGEIKMQNLTGSLQIGSANYSISTGHGDSNKQGEFVIFGETSAGELILHGTIQNNSTVTVDSPSSRLSSLAYLALSGSMTVNNTGSGSAMTMSSSQNVTSTSEIENKTSIITSANATSEITQQYGSSSPLATANVTSQFSTTNATENAALTGDSTMITHLNNQTTSNALPEQTNVTVTTTQPSNQTITVYVTQTVANSTVTHVTTVPNATITQTSVTTVANVTVTVTNSTTSGP